MERLAIKVEPIGEWVEAIGEKVEVIGERVEPIGEKLEAIGERVEPIGERLESIGEWIHCFSRMLETMMRHGERNHQWRRGGENQILWPSEGSDLAKYSAIGYPSVSRKNLARVDAGRMLLAGAATIRPWRPGQ